jgi:uncharacterized protein (DUF1778 family)
MPRTAVNRDDRLELRARREEKRLLAAAHQRLDVTSVVMRSALPAARKGVERNERINLSARDAELILALLDNPPKSGKAVLEAARACRTQHDRGGLDCGSPDLNVELARYARQNHDSGGAKTSATEPARILAEGRS